MPSDALRACVSDVMDCPVCGGRSEVTHTQRGSESVVRDRRCKLHGHTFATRETIIVKQRKERRAAARPRRESDWAVAEDVAKVDVEDFWTVDDREEAQQILRDMGVQDG